MCFVTVHLCVFDRLRYRMVLVVPLLLVTMEDWSKTEKTNEGVCCCNLIHLRDNACRVVISYESNTAASIS